MNSYSNTQNSGLLKKVYPQGGPVSQMNNKPEMVALRQRMKK